MQNDRRKTTREQNDRRRETRWEVPPWGYVLAIAAVGALLWGFWALVYR